MMVSNRNLLFQGEMFGDSWKIQPWNLDMISVKLSSPKAPGTWWDLAPFFSNKKATNLSKLGDVFPKSYGK